jgi:putative ABC transport system permease protein
MKFFPLIWSNLRRKKARTLLTTFSVVVAFILFAFLCSIKHALTAGVQLAGANRLIVRHKVSIIQLLPESYKARMERIPGVAKATHQTWFGGHFGDSKHFFAQMPVVPEEFLQIHPEIVLSPDQKEAFFRTRTGAIVGRKTAQHFGWKVGDKVPIISSIWVKTDATQVWQFDIVGIFDGNKTDTDTTPMFFHYDYFDEARRWSKGNVGWYTILIQNPDEAAHVAQRVDAEFQNSTAETKTEPEAAFMQGFAKQIGDIALITALILGAVFFTILLVTGNTMSQAIRERTGELGVLKALGFTNGQVLMLVMVESCLLAGLGGVIGLTLGWVLTLGGDPTGGQLPLLFFPSRDVLVGLAITVALGVITGIFPAYQAMRLRVADSLRKL